MTRRSAQVPARAAAMTPSGTAISTATMSVHKVSDTVGWTRCPISVVTGRLVKIDVPRSPCSSRHTQPPNCTRNGWSRPSFARICLMSSAVAMSPAITAAGSPGVRNRSENTTSATTAITMNVAPRRRRM